MIFLPIPLLTSLTILNRCINFTQLCGRQNWFLTKILIQVHTSRYLMTYKWYGLAMKKKKQQHTLANLQNYHSTKCTSLQKEVDNQLPWVPEVF